MAAIALPPVNLQKRESEYGHQTQRLAAMRQRPAGLFHGTVRIDPLNIPPDPAQVSMALVTFEPGARTAWHTHPLGQTLIVTSGRGHVQREGGPIQHAGKANGSPVEWMEKTSDVQCSEASDVK